jgi:hypothetical protein
LNVPLLIDIVKKVDALCIWESALSSFSRHASEGWHPASGAQSGTSAFAGVTA